MSKLKPVSRRDLIRRLRQLGFSGPFSGAKHSYMFREGVDIRIPNPHRQEIGRGLLSGILKQAGVSRREWLHEK